MPERTASKEFKMSIYPMIVYDSAMHNGGTLFSLGVYSIVQLHLRHG